ncbi:MAG: hypothetical protein M0R46_00390 [Candidatus Muirbacterium halophilum]|nr:hypothetical protein [Candidatus Muirbacterium halophilum]MCK9474351.1 hypothetical protein [Candidatus Muirbacterium halophilum]
MEQAFWVILTLSSVISILICIIFIYFYNKFKKTFFLELALASFLYAIHIPVINLITSMTKQSLIGILSDKILLISASYLFVHAISKLTEIKFYKIIHSIFIFVFFLVITLEIYCNEIFIKGSAGLIIFATAFIYCGILFFRNKTFIRHNRIILGSLFVIWGLIPFLYIPYYLNDKLPLIPVMLIFTVKLLINFFIIILFFEESRKEVLIKNFEITSLENTKKQILSTITHDIKSPLTSLSGYCELIVSEKLGTLTKEQKEKILIMKKNIDKINSITDRISFYSKLTRFEKINQVEKISIKKLLFDISVYIRKINPGISINFEFPEDELIIQVDFTKLSELFYILTDIMTNFENNPSINILFISYQDKDKNYIFENKFYYKEKIQKNEILNITDEQKTFGANLINKIFTDINANMNLDIKENENCLIIKIKLLGFPLD